MKPRIDPMFVAYVKEEVADGETVTILVGSEDEVPAWIDRFTEEELDSITFAVSTRTP
jgi:hypothetical protein